MENTPQPAAKIIVPPLIPDDGTPCGFALEQHFLSFMAYFFPDTDSQINWTFQHEFLAKELQATANDALMGTHHCDKLVKLRRFSGEEDWLCIHLEVQVSLQTACAERMFIYHYRKPAASMALPGDASPNWLPQKNGHAALGGKLELEFPIETLLHFPKPGTTWGIDSKPFPLLALHKLIIRPPTPEMNCRYETQCKMARMLHAHKWDATLIRHFFQLIDWMMPLPLDLELKFSTFIGGLEEGNGTEYISPIEQVRSEQRFHEGEQGGKTELLSRLLTRRFGNLPPATQARIKQATIEQIDIWFDRGMDAATLDEVFQGLAH
jgi:hypothetical protein